MNRLLECHGKTWILDPHSILQRVDGKKIYSHHPNATIRIFAALQTLDTKQQINHILERIYTVALCGLKDVKGAHNKITFSSLYQGRDIESAEYQRFEKSIGRYLSIGHQWQWIIDQLQGTTGVLCVLGFSYK